MIKKDITKRICFDNFKSIKHFEIYFFNYLKTLNKDKENWIIIYTLKKEEEIFDYLVNIFLIKVEKIKDYFTLNNIILKIFNVPFCITHNKDLINKYLISDIFYNKIYVIPKKNKNCYNCNYYFICSWNKSENFLNFPVENISKKDFINWIEEVFIFFENIWISRDFIYFDFLFDLEYDFDFLNKNLARKIELFIDGTKWINYDDYFLSWENNVEEVRTNLFFKNYIIQCKFEKLISKLNFSIFLSFTNFDIYFYKTNKNIFKTDDDWIKKHNWICYWFLRKKDISMYLWENIIFKKELLLWKDIIWKPWYFNRENNLLDLKVIHLKDIINIKTDYDKYVVLFFEHDLNQHIPYVYNFKYFISFNKLEYLAHYSIILKEIWASFIDSIWTWYFYWLKNNDLLNIDFNTWIIKRIW